jgi:hypothetical protein
MRSADSGPQLQETTQGSYGLRFPGNLQSSIVGIWDGNVPRISLADKSWNPMIFRDFRLTHVLPSRLMASSVAGFG